MTQKSRHFLMHWMSVKLSDHFQIREHSWPCLFHINYLPLQLHQHKRISPYVWLRKNKTVSVIDHLHKSFLHCQEIKVYS